MNRRSDSRSLFCAWQIGKSGRPYHARSLIEVHKLCTIPRQIICNNLSRYAYCHTPMYRSSELMQGHVMDLNHLRNKNHISGAPSIFFCFCSLVPNPTFRFPCTDSKFQLSVHAIIYTN